MFIQKKMIYCCCGFWCFVVVVVCASVFVCFEFELLGSIAILVCTLQ